MKRNHVTQAYQNAEMQALQETDDPHKVILTMLEALVKSMTVFELNVDLRNGGDNELKSKHFARALIIIYALQSALDFEKGGEISNNLSKVFGSVMTFANSFCQEVCNLSLIWGIICGISIFNF